MWDSEKTWKVLKGAGIAGIGAGLAYLTAYLGDLDLGAWGPAVAAVLAVVANALRQTLEIPEVDESDPNDTRV